jgi:ATP-dependent Clp protease ATP-binding subunit ClpB
VETRIARALIAGEIREGATITIEAHDDELAVSWQGGEEEPTPAEPEAVAA